MRTARYQTLTGKENYYTRDGLLIPRDPKRGCGTPDPTIGSLNYGKDYGYQYHVPSAEETTHRGRRFNLIDFIKETMTGAVTGGLASATFYGAGKAVEALKESIRNLRNPETRIPLDLQFFAGKDNKVYFGQKAVSPNFSKGGTFEGQSIQSISEKLSFGSLSPDDVPIEYILREGKMITMNNRSLTALSKAGLKPSKLIDVTGNALEETRLTQRLNEMGGVPSESIFVRKIKEIVHIPN